MTGKELVNLCNNKILRSKNIEYNGSSLNEFLGTIIESGNNDNGNWIKLFDGTLIQYGKVNKAVSIADREAGWYYDYDGKQINFPLKFIDKNIFVTVTANTDSIRSLIISTVPINESYCEFFLSNHTETATSNYEFSWLAIGKWK